MNTAEARSSPPTSSIARQFCCTAAQHTSLSVRRSWQEEEEEEEEEGDNYHHHCHHRHQCCDLLALVSLPVSMLLQWESFDFVEYRMVILSVLRGRFFDRMQWPSTWASLGVFPNTTADIRRVSPPLLAPRHTVLVRRVQHTETPLRNCRRNRKEKQEPESNVSHTIQQSA